MFTRDNAGSEELGETGETEKKKENNLSDLGGPFGFWVAKIMRPINKKLRWLVLKAPMDTVMWVAVVYGGGCSIVLSFLPIKVLHFLVGNGFIANHVKTNPMIRTLVDIVVTYVNDHTLLRFLSIFVSLMIAMILIVPLVLFSILTNPRALRSILAVVVMPLLISLIFWKFMRHNLPAFLTESETLSMFTGSVVVSKFIIIAIGIGTLYFPEAVKWGLGEFTVVQYLITLSASMTLGTLLAILHVEGNRQTDGSTLDERKVHPASLCIAGFAAITMMLVMPLINRRVYARLRLLRGS
jgi:hypothetical protein